VKIPLHHNASRLLSTLRSETLVLKIIALISTLTPVAACASWANKQDYRLPRCLNRFGYIRCDTTISVLTYFSGCELFYKLCLPKQFVHHSMPPHKSAIISEIVITPINFEICGCRTALISNKIDYKIWSIIQQRAQSTKVQDVKDLMQRLIGAWAGVKEGVIRW